MPPSGPGTQGCPPDPSCADSKGLCVACVSRCVHVCLCVCVCVCTSLPPTDTGQLTLVTPQLLTKPPGRKPGHGSCHVPLPRPCALCPRVAPAPTWSPV